MESCIEIRGLLKVFGKKKAVNNLNLSIPRGSVFALLGDNGAGKTTTIRMLCGLLPPDRGSATILGLDCWRDAPALRAKVGYVPEKPRFYDWMTVAEVGQFVGGFHPPEYYPRYEEQITRFQLEGYSKLSKLSKGQYSKVALALALAADPEVLILDEPTSGLDLFVRREFLSSMVGLAEEGKTVVISSHQIAEVERIASHAAFISKGQLHLAAPMDELKQRIMRYRLQFETHAPDAEPLGKVLQRNGSGKLWQAIIQDPNRQAIESLRELDGISDFEETSLSLEEVYTALMGPR